MTTTRLICVALCSSLVACGGGGGTQPPDAAQGSAAARITIAGTAKAQGAGSSTPLAGVAVGAYKTGDDAAALATATTDQQGNYTLEITTGGVALDGYVKASITGYLDTYLYPPAPLTSDFTGAALNLVSTNLIGLLAQNFCGATSYSSTDGIVAVAVVNAAMMPVAGATVSATPAAMTYCYNAGSPAVPNKSATMTATDGLAYMIQVTGETSLSATKSGSAFNAHTVNSRAGALTTTIITGQ